MKNYRMLCAVSLFVHILFISAYSQNIAPHAGGEYRFNERNVDCLDDDARQKIKEKFLIFVPNRKLSASEQSVSIAQFSWPLRLKTGINDPGYYGISAFVDHDTSYPNSLQDYTNGIRTYDRENGYNHQGTDFFLWPFTWLKMDAGEVDVIAVADGIIVGKEEGNYDRNCDFVNDQWNALYVKNFDSTVVWYGHLKKNSVTMKQTGDTIKSGEYVGIVGSSGSSSGPHLHLEVFDKNMNLIDPWFGPGNPTIASSWWEKQEPYYHSRINKIATHNDWPEFPVCPNPEIPHFQKEFAPGDTIRLVAYYQDQLRDQLSTFTLTMPDNIQWQQWTSSLTSADHYPATWWGYYWILPSNALLGDWTFTVAYEGNIYNTTFTVTNSPTHVVDQPFTITPDHFLYDPYPNPFNPAVILRYRIPQKEHVLLTVHDLLGREIARLVDDVQNGGVHEIRFDASGHANGTYLYRLHAGRFETTKKMILLR